MIFGYIKTPDIKIYTISIQTNHPFSLTYAYWVVCVENFIHPRDRVSTCVIFQLQN